MYGPALRPVPSATGPATPATSPGPARTGGSGNDSAAFPNALPSRSGGGAAPGQSLPPNPSPSARFDSPPLLKNVPAGVKFGPGFEIRSEDDEYIFQFHNLTQLDYRGYTPANQSVVKDTFAFPRQWFMFSGRITKPLGYFVSLAEGFDTVNILDVFLDINADPRFNIRMGRYKMTFTYEFFVEPPQALISPEYSLFFNNFGQNRDLGVMAYGRILQNKVDYAAGIFNGSRNGFLATQDQKYFSGFLNWKPFGNAEDSLLENFNVGGSVFAGDTTTPIVPNPPILRTSVPTSGNALLSEPFLAFNSAVRQSGLLAFWDLTHGLFLQPSSDGLRRIGRAVSRITLLRAPLRTGPVCRFRAYYIQAGYFLTGERVGSIGVVKPLSPFDIRRGHFGTGAWEITGRYSTLNVGDEVFTTVSPIAPSSPTA